MAKSRDGSGSMEITTPGERRGGFFNGFVVPLLIVVVIILITVFFLVKTDGGKSFIADKLGKYLGMNVELATTRIGWPYMLIMEGVKAKEKDSDKVSIAAESVEFCYDWKFRKKISVIRGELKLMQGAEGDWLPHVFSKLGAVQSADITHLAKLLDMFDSRMVLDINDSAISWLDKGGKKVSSVSGIYFISSPVKIYRHDMRYFSLAVSSGMIKGSKIGQIDKKEWLASKRKSYLGLDDDAVGVTENSQLLLEEKAK